MCAPAEIAKDNAAILAALGQKSQEVASLTDEQLVSIARELLKHFQNSEKDWCRAGNWLEKELEVLKIKKNSEKISDLDNMAFIMGSSIRSTLTNSLYAYLATTIKSLEERIAERSSELVSKKRVVHTAEGYVEVHGPVSLPMIPGMSFETWSGPSAVQPKKHIKSGGASQKEGVCLVLGAGNQSLLSAIDTLHSFFELKRPVLLKHHPVRPHLIHPYSIILAPLLEKGYMMQVPDEGIAKTGELLKNEAVGHVHVTGAYATACAIEKTLLQTRSDVKNEDEAAQMVTSELGCATPWILSPAEYTEVELRNVAKAFATSKKTNGGSNCLCGQVIVMPKEWKQNKEFRGILMNELRSTSKDPVYYPGSIAKRRSSLQEYKKLGNDRFSIIKSSSCVINSVEEDDDLLVVECGTPGEDGFNGFSLTEEAFGPVAAIVEMPGGADGTDPAQYMEDTVAPFINDKSKIFGTLSCTLLWPKSLEGKSDGGLTKAIASLKYGTVAVNVWSILGYLAMLQGGTWGGHPREARRQSGAGLIGNHFDLPIEKTIVYGPPLTTAPLIDKTNLPPAIVTDCLHELYVSSSTATATINIWLLLVIRFAQYVLPNGLSKMIFGELPYGSGFR